LVLICNSPSKIIEPVRSRCLGIRIPSATNDEIASVLVQIAKKESVICPAEFAMKISQSCDRNLRRAILMLEAARMQINPSQQLALHIDQPVPLPDWELFVVKLAKEILQEQSPSKLLQAREMLYELLTNCIPADVILVTLNRELMKSLDDTLKHEIAYWAAYYEHRIVQGSKDIFHLEAFVAKFMAVYKKWIVSLFC
jgi:replication factor C subunit 3/5